MRIIFCLLLIHAQVIQAQTPEEWTKQRKTQIKYLAEQIVALKEYGRMVRKGYEAANSGLNLIQTIKEGDRLLHYPYFSSLAKVNPVLKEFKQLLAIIRFQASIVNNCRKMKEWLAGCYEFSQEEKQYFLSKIHCLLIMESYHSRDLASLTSNEKIELKDDERISRIVKLYKDFQKDNYFSQNLMRQIYTLGLQRSSEKVQTNTLKSMHGIN